MTDIECLTNLLHYNDLMDIRAYINDANDQWYPHYKKEKKKNTYGACKYGAWQCFTTTGSDA